VLDGLRVGEAPRDSTTAFGVAAESIGIVVHVTDVGVSAFGPVKTNWRARLCHLSILHLFVDPQQPEPHAAA
jgi:hypothetical protein